ncbi:hypothetical protein PHYBLDRAFT_166675 [Phycomyces blakesleeanus NRRL 1555(-)]|uniref:Uncharacterized protein n=2 Tax=Phycomyces blakesleeanus TaxID=4837 RepID=A0A162UDF5_PHYB8|nr:hypothetical protein PHYBLDRAFT_166675 [Phycomyces blakesleeanus NRRL 1555(-)]OAD75432.1 hypothetical protein PHYBLDRAFT_166675 [Phycomyces blakesleeanus NRRL 1555(-)]|eukprot:XP_018293472.1 hypothetical protein PHYBLDRAFT_166675 [Phycomyces blakesleeanus NRRL 1555(-)]
MKTNFTLDHCHQVLAREKKWIDAVMKSVEKKRAKNSKTGANSVATTTTTTTTTTAAATATATATADVDVAVANTLEEADSGSDISLSPPTGRTQQMVTNEPKKRSFQEMMQTFSARIDETTTLEVNDTSDLTNKVAKDQAAAQLLLVKEQIRVAEAERLVAEERILLTKAQRLIAEAQFIAIDANEIKDPTKRQWMLNMQNKIMEKGSGDSRNNVDSN